MRQFNVDTKNPEIEKAIQRKDRDEKPATLSGERNQSLPRYVQQYPELLDFYNEFDELDITPQDVKTYEKFLKRLDDDERELLDSPVNLYFVDFHNLGGLVMPVIVQIEFEDGSRQTMRYPAEVWTRNNQQITKLIADRENDQIADA